MKTALSIVLGLIVIAAIGLLVSKGKPEQPNEPASSTKGTSIFSTPKKSPHFETSSPTHGTTLAGAPIAVVVDFNFDLNPNSSITVTKDGKDYALGQTTIDENKLTMRRQFDPKATDGTYTVNYSACWPDGSCHEGNHQFAIDRGSASSFTDQTGQKEITVRMSQIKFQPVEIKISKGTKVTWVNDDSVEHFVNTEAHPSHTYFVEQNSRGLDKGQSFSTTFDAVGFYPYHCSAHVPQKMNAAILVI